MNARSQIEIPRGAELKALLDLDHNPALDDLFSQVLRAPIEDLFARPKKSIRSDLVDLGFALCGTDSVPENLRSKLYEILEVLHAGSLIIDDIEDDSHSRRGKPTLHREYGLSIALNAGNWLYFLPFQFIDELPLDLSLRQALSRECQRTLLLAHYGQALDVGINVETLAQSRVPEVALSSMELKSGVLAAFAFQVAFIASGKTEVPAQVTRWGRRIGTALQMFDDIGNFKNEKTAEKRYEDLKLRRLCYIFANVAKVYSEKEYQEFWRLAHEPDGAEHMIRSIIDKEIVGEALHHASSFLAQIEADLENHPAPPQALELFQQLKRKLGGAYV